MPYSTMSHAERKCYLIMAMIMFKVALCYILIIDQVAMSDEHILWVNLKWNELVLILAPALFSIVHGLILLYMYSIGHRIDWTDRYQCSPYIGSKFNI